MDNIYYKNNYRKSKKTVPSSDHHLPYIRLSDTLYDSSKGTDFYFLNIGTDESPLFRTISDVELAYSTDLAIQSIISPTMQQNLRLSLSTMKHSDTSTSVVTPQSLELDERIEYGKVLMAKHVDFSKSHVDQVPLAPSIPPSGEVTPTDGSPTTKE